jgi:hypothetical protein
MACLDAHLYEIEYRLEYLVSDKARLYRFSFKINTYIFIYNIC